MPGDGAHGDLERAGDSSRNRTVPGRMPISPAGMRTRAFARSTRLAEVANTTTVATTASRLVSATPLYGPLISASAVAAISENPIARQRSSDARRSFAYYGILGILRRPGRRLLPVTVTPQGWEAGRMQAPL